MDLQTYAYQVLNARTLAEKLKRPSKLSLGAEHDEVVYDLDNQPLPDLGLDGVRAKDLDSSALSSQNPSVKPASKRAFPKQHQWREPWAKAMIFHQFANHECMAMDIMACMLLRFPRAEKAFRLGLAHAMREEQEHASLYLEQVERHGFAWGDFASNRMFYTALAQANTLAEYLAGLCLTFEQANLDFAKQYGQHFHGLGDHRSADVLRKVYEDEIGHVGLGRHWLLSLDSQSKKLQHPSTADWTTYQKYLPCPLQAARGRGDILDIEGRRRAGLSEHFIDHMRVQHKGSFQLTRLWWPNLLFERELWTNQSSAAPSKPQIQSTLLDLQMCSLWLAQKTDGVILDKEPSIAWQSSWQNLGLQPAKAITPPAGEVKQQALFKRCLPAVWGWSAAAISAFRNLTEPLQLSTQFKERLIEEESRLPLTRNLNSKAFVQQWAKHRQDLTCTSDVHILESLEACKEIRKARFPDGYVCKAPWGFSGRGVRFSSKNEPIATQSQLETKIEAWISNTLRKQKHVLLEPKHDVVLNMSLHMDIEQERVRYKGVSYFETDAFGQYKTAWLGSGGLKGLAGLANLTGLEGLSTKHRTQQTQQDLLRFLHEPGHRSTRFQQWKAQLLDCGRAFAEMGYRGPIGMDAYIYKCQQHGELRLRPLVEVNARQSFARLALFFEQHVDHKQGVAKIHYLNHKDITSLGYQDIKAFCEQTCTLFWNRSEINTASHQHAKPKLGRGLYPLNDPHLARQVLVLLSVGMDIPPARH